MSIRADPVSTKVIMVRSPIFILVYVCPSMAQTGAKSIIETSGGCIAAERMDAVAGIRAASAETY